MSDLWDLSSNGVINVRGTRTVFYGTYLSYDSCDQGYFSKVQLKVPSGHTIEETRRMKVQSNIGQSPRKCKDIEPIKSHGFVFTYLQSEGRSYGLQCEGNSQWPTGYHITFRPVLSDIFHCHASTLVTLTSDSFLTRLDCLKKMEELLARSRFDAPNKKGQKFVATRSHSISIKEEPVWGGAFHEPAHSLVCRIIQREYFEQKLNVNIYGTSFTGQVFFDIKNNR